MKKVLLILNLTLVAAILAAMAFCLRELAVVRHERDELEDDKAALQLERAELASELEQARQDLAKKSWELEKVQGDKESLGRSLVKAMDSCTKLQQAVKQLEGERDVDRAAAIEKAVQERLVRIQAEQQRQAREQAEKERLAKEQAAKAKAEQERLARERAPLKVEELRPLDPKAKTKSDKESLDELFDLTTPKKAK